MKKNYGWKIAGAALLSVAVIAGGTAVGIQQYANIAGDKAGVIDGTKQTVENGTYVAKQLSTKKEKHEITIHYKWKGSQPHLYYKVEGSKEQSTYPGVPMKDEGNGWFTYTIADAEAADLIMSVPEMDCQTSDFTRLEGEYWYDDETGWYSAAPSFYENPAKTETTENQKQTAQKEDAEEVVMDENNLAEESAVTLHFPGTWDTANVYYWNALPIDEEVAWPGEALEKDADGYYTYTIDGVNKVNFLFNNGKEQTDDFTVKSAGEYWYSNGKWVTTKPEESGKIDTTEQPGTTDDPGNVSGPTATPTGGGTGGSPLKPKTGDFRDESIYFVITTRFYDGDPSNNQHCSGENAGTSESDPSWRGDFKGLIEKLDYIKALGFSAIWITPVVENRSGLDYHGYHAYDFSKVDSRYESADTSYQDLIDAAHAKGIKIIQDVVFNHTCNWGERNLLQLNFDSYPARGATVMNGANDPDNIYHHNGFTGGGDWDNYKAQNTTIADDCFDLETENPKVYNYLIDCYKKYINMGVDGFRVDTVKHISRLTLNSTIIPAMRKAGGDSFYMFGEVCTKGHDVWYRDAPPISTCFYTWADDDSWTGKWSQDLSSNESLVESHYEANMNGSSQPTNNNEILEGNNYHNPDYTKSSGLNVIDFQMHWSFDSAEQAFNTAKGEDQYFNDSTWNVTYVDSHDYGPDNCQTLRYNGGEEAWAENLDLLFTFRGIPCIFYGSEVQFQAGKTIDKGGLMPLAETGRAYFGDYIEGDVSASDYGTYTASGKVKETLESPLSQQIIRLNKIRRAVPALCKGQYSTEDVNGNMAFKRRYTANGIDSFVCVAITNGATFNGLPGGTYVDVVSGDTKKVTEGGSLEIAAPGKGNMRAYVLQNDTASAYGANGKIGEDGTYLK